VPIVVRGVLAENSKQMSFDVDEDMVEARGGRNESSAPSTHAVGSIQGHACDPATMLAWTQERGDRRPRSSDPVRPARMDGMPQATSPTGVPYKFGAESSRGAGFGIRAHPSLWSAAESLRRDR
jgi:hypothetical protein